MLSQIVGLEPVWLQRFPSVLPYNDPFPSISKRRDAIFTAETVAQRESPIFLKQVLELTNSFGAIRTVASGMVSERCVGKQT